MRQALLNDASNAEKLTETGMVRLTASLLDETPSELHIRFAVEDSGVGIAPDQIGRLFGIVEQVDASPSRRHGGTGLGLAITKRPAALMGGAVGVDSAPGIGSTFWFTARLGRSPRAASVLSAAPDTDIEAQLRQRHGGARKLFAEDNPMNLEVALGVLESVGFSPSRLMPLATTARLSWRQAWTTSSASLQPVSLRIAPTAARQTGSRT